MHITVKQKLEDFISQNKATLKLVQKDIENNNCNKQTRITNWNTNK